MANFFKNNKPLKIKAIETNYKGYRMRSRLEARWAIFFDNLNMKWWYEPEGFSFNGERYLPDFYLPDFDGGTFAEVKFEATPKEIDLCRQVSNLTGKIFLICEGVPGPQSLKYFYPDEDWTRQGYPKFDHGYEENRMWDSGGDTLSESDIEASICEYTKAVKAARAARFEHNELKR